MIKIVRKITILILVIPCIITYGQNQNIDHSVFTEVLNSYVKNGLVDYKNLKDDNRLYEYVDYISKIDPEDIKSENEKIAFYINAYNAFTLKIICDNYPVEGINDLNSGGRIISHVLGTTVWDKDLVVINGKKTTLNHVEHDILRRKYDEPRIHFALVCAAISCPPLRNEAYTRDKLNEQLDDQAKTFLNDSRRNKFDLKAREAELSKILDWYGDDFADNEEDLLIYISKYLPVKIAKDIQKNADEWDVDFLSYNWSLNEYE
jgi:hypothetical protein